MSEPISADYDVRASPARHTQDAQALQSAQADFAAATPLGATPLEGTVAGSPARDPSPVNAGDPPYQGAAPEGECSSVGDEPLHSLRRRAPHPPYAMRWHVAHSRDLIVSIIAVLAVISLLALLLARILAAQHTIATLAAANAANHPNATLSAAGPTIGHPAPDFTLTAWNAAPGAAHTISLSALAGHPVVVNFWAPWCAPCQQEAPLLAAAAHAYAAQGVVFLGVAFDTNQHDVAAFLQRAGITYPCGPDATGAIASVYALPGIPVTVFINRHGIIAQKSIGPLTVSSLQAALHTITP